MAKSSLSVDQAVEDIVKSIPQFGDRVYVGAIPHGQSIPTDGRSYILPYVVMYFSGMIGSPVRGKGIVSSNEDSKRHTISIEVFASDYWTSMEMLQLVRDELEGYTHPGCSQMVEFSSAPTTNPQDGTLRPMRFGHGIVFHLIID